MHHRIFSVHLQKLGIALAAARDRPVVPLVEADVAADALCRAPRVRVVGSRHAGQRQLAGFVRALQLRRKGHVDGGRAKSLGAQQLAGPHGLHAAFHRERNVGPAREAGVCCGGKKSIYAGKKDDVQKEASMFERISS